MAKTATAPERYTIRVFIEGMQLYGKTVDRGQVITMQDAPNNERLVRLRYIIPFSGETFTCSECGAEFDSLGARNQHGLRRHPRAGRKLVASDLVAEDEKMNFEETPPAWEKSESWQKDH